MGATARSARGAVARRPAREATNPPALEAANWQVGLSEAPDTLGTVTRGQTRRSVCSGGVPVTFYWFECTNRAHRAAAVAALLAAIDGPCRLRSPYRTAMAKAEFDGRLQQAEQGRLKPVDHVKTIDSYPQIDMFEVRWDSIPVVERGAGGQQVYRTVLVRLYYFELPDRGVAVLGCHAHEKTTDESNRENTAAQDAEIERAVQLYATGMASHWGIPELCD